LAWQVTVVNAGDPITRGGIVFASGPNVIRNDTLELLSALGLLNSLATPLLTFDFSEIETAVSGSIVFTGTAAAHKL